MDRYHGVKIFERECLSAASSLKKPTLQQTLDAKSDSQDSLVTTEYTSFPRLPSNLDEQKQRHSRTDSAHEMSDNESDYQIDPIQEAFARYTDASPPCSDAQYEGKSEEEQANMRMRDYAKELSRIMGRQLVQGLKNDRGNGNVHLGG